MGADNQCMDDMLWLDLDAWIPVSDASSCLLTRFRLLEAVPAKMTWFFLAIFSKKQLLVETY
jgi:hypothetical protein